MVGRRHVGGRERGRAPDPTRHVPVTASAEPLDLPAILSAAGEVPYAWSIDTDALVWGGNAADVLPVDLAECASGGAYAALIDPQTQSARSAMLASGPDDGAGVGYQMQYALRLSSGLAWVEECGRWFAGADGAPLRAHGVIRPIGERYAREQQLERLARFDPLTGEMNRWHLLEILDSTIEQAVKLRSSCGFMLIAIDNLRRINQAYGFDVADEVIAAIAKRMRTQLRSKDHLGRMSSNKFGIILNNCTPDDMLITADRLLVKVRDEVVQTTAGQVAVTVTIGGITAPRFARTVREVLARAHDALAGAKAKRRGSFQAYQPNVEREGLRRENVRATDEIIAALNERRIFLVYEPVVEITSRKPAFYECLMRVRREDGSLIAVNEVIPRAERLGLVRLIDHRVLELVLSELAKAPTLRASLNVSAASTVDPDWWSALDVMLRAHRGVGERLTVEITETAAIHDLDETRGFVARVKDLGCRIAIDDFGAGYTSFRNLRKLGVDLVKIDGAFVQNLRRSEDDRAFVHTLIDLAQRLGLDTVAEWVQDDEAAAILRDWGCNYLQGALVGLASEQRPWLQGPVAVAESA